MGAHAVAVLTASLLFFAATGLAQAHSRHGARLAQNQPPPLQGTCSGVRLAAHASCVSSDWVNEGERWLIAGEDEAMGASLCVYLSRWDGRSWVWTGSPGSCNTEPDFVTEGVSGHPTIYNGSNYPVTAVLAVFR
jgi:hypothetical protein